MAISAIVFVGLLAFALFGYILFSAEIVAALIAFSGIVMASFITQYYTHKREIEARLFEKKIFSYERVFDLLLKVIENINIEEDVANFKKNFSHDFIFIDKSFMIWGGPNLIDAWQKYKDTITDSSACVVSILISYSQLLVAIRKDIKHGDNLNELNVIRLFIKKEYWPEFKKLLT